MDGFLKTCLIVCPLVFLAGFVDSVAGGGGIISLPAYLMAGLPAQLAAGTNKVANGTGSLIAALRYLRGGRIRLRTAAATAAGSIAGAVAGTQLAASIPEAALKAIILVSLPCVAVFLAVNKNFGRDDAGAAETDPKRELPVAVLIGTFAGCYDGLVGPGTGTFLILCFTAFLSMDLLTASGCAKAANLASCIGSAVVWSLHGCVYWRLAVPALASSVLGNWLGARYAIHGGVGKVRSMMFVVLGLLFAKLLYDVLT